MPGASFDLNFAGGTYYPLPVDSAIGVVRASAETTLLPSSASGATIQSFGSGVLAIAPGFGLQAFQAATNNLLNSTAPVTQTTASLGTGTYTLWVNGSGSATPSGGTATITGAAAASNGSPNTFTVTVAGTVTITKSGALNAFQLESGSLGTPLIVTAGATASRALDTITGPLGSWFNPSAGTFVTQWSAVVPPSANAPVAGFIKDSANALYPFLSGTACTYFSKAANTIQYSTASGVTLVNGATNKVAVGYGATPDFGAVNNGNTQSLAQTALPAGLTTLILGSASPFGGDGPLNGYIKRFTYFPTRLTNAQIQALTV